jgi:hypothetical protein
MTIPREENALLRGMKVVVPGVDLSSWSREEEKMEAIKVER